MKKYVPFGILLLGLVYLGSTMLPPRHRSDFDLSAFGRLPVLLDGRIKPLDTVARNSLLIMQGHQRFVAPDGQVMPPIAWLLDVLFNPSVADHYKQFAIYNPDVRSIFGLTDADTKIHYQTSSQKTMASLGLLPARSYLFSYDQLRQGLSQLERQEKMAEPVPNASQTAFQRGVINLYQSLVLYQRLKASLNIEASPDFLASLERLQKNLPADSAAFLAKQAGKPYDKKAYQDIMDYASEFEYMSNAGYLLAIPPDPSNSNKNDWSNAGDALVASFRQGAINPDVMAYAALGHAWRLKEPNQFNTIVELYHRQLTKRFSHDLLKCRVEAAFNRIAPFSSSMTLYVLTFLLAVVSWLRWPDLLQRSALWLMLLAFVASTGGIVVRMWLEGRPPVTNLYSSAVFVGWVAVALCLVLEWMYKNAIGAVAGSMIGFSTLLIAHHLALGGDTMEMMRAVLDNNYWLATHVVVITMGYGATYLAGFLAIIYIFRGLFTKSLTKDTAAALTRMVYGIVCFATLFSFVGTVLGGIWADQSWGTFWGWDPKENGALIIVLWNAIILHCRWGGMVRQRGLMMLAVFGNIVTSWSWFGTNMLGVGLHSYGFTEAAFTWLITFVVTQLVIIAIAATPLDKWRSFHHPPRGTRPGLAASS